MKFFFNIQNLLDHILKEIFYKLTQIFIIEFSSFLAVLDRNKLRKSPERSKKKLNLY